MRQLPQMQINRKMYDVKKIRNDFPILGRTVYGKPLVYFDNAATTQKPRMVVDSIADEYYSVNANVHRGVHFLSQQATDRSNIDKFLFARLTESTFLIDGGVIISITAYRTNGISGR